MNQNKEITAVLEESIYSKTNQLLANKVNESLDNWVKEQLKLVTPPIKGEITQSKLKWRGVKLCSTNSILTYGMGAKPITFTKYWIEQRGKKIGKEYIVN